MTTPIVQVGELALNDSGAFKIGPFGSSLKKTELVESGIPVAGIENVLPNTFVKGFRRFITRRKFDELSDYIFEMCHCCSLASGEVASRPYDGASSGLTSGDGSAFFVLERPEHAKARGAQPLAYLKGYATVTDCRAVRNPVERDTGDIAEAIRRGLRDADITPEDVSFVSGAANGYPAFDQPELEAIASALPSKPEIFSVKGGVGETWGASGGISIIAAVRALGEKTLPPTVGAPVSIGSNIVTGKPARLRKGAAVVLSMEMSGQDSAFILSDEL